MSRCVLGHRRWRQRPESRNRVLGVFVPPRQKINMPRSVDEHEARIPMLDHRLRREDGDAALALDCIGIQVRVAVIDASAGADLPRVEEHCLGKRGLTCIHMRQDADNCLLHAFPSQSRFRCGHVAAKAARRGRRRAPMSIAMSVACGSRHRFTCRPLSHTAA